MKVYVPSHKRPDAPLFNISTELIIVLQHEEDVEPYSKWKDRHNVIYIPELRGLLDARNWILENNDDWVLMLDDDILEFFENSKSINWEDFLSKSYDILSQIDKSKVGVVGINMDRKEKMLPKESYSITNKFCIFQVIFLNCKLLKSKGYKYDSYPYDGENGQRAYGEDWDILFYCYQNNIQMGIMNFLSYKVNNKHKSVCWKDDKYLYQLLTQFWLLEKYNDNKEIVKKILSNIKSFINTCKDYYLNDNNKIMEKISYEILNKDEEESEMKKKIINGVLTLLTVGVIGMGVVSCGGDDGNGDNTPKRVVAEEYRGEFWDGDGSGIYGVNKIYLTENKMRRTGSSIDVDIDIKTLTPEQMEELGVREYFAWTEGGTLKYTERVDGSGSGMSFGGFLDIDTFQTNGSINYYRKK